MKSWIVKMLNYKLWPIIWTIFIFIMCTLPSKRFLENQHFSDKSLHIFAFTVFSFLWFFQVKSAYKILLYGIFYGVFIEIWQHLLPVSFHRGFEWLDMVADAIGSVIGFVLALVLSKKLNG